MQGRRRHPPPTAEPAAAAEILFDPVESAPRLRAQPSAPAGRGVQALENRIKTLSEKVQALEDERSRFFASAVVDLPLYSVVPQTPDQLRNNVVDNISACDDLEDCELERHTVSYPQVDGACGLIFMKLWQIDSETADITKLWVPFSVRDDSDGIEAKEILGIDSEEFIFMDRCDFAADFQTAGP